MEHRIASQGLLPARLNNHPLWLGHSLSYLLINPCALNRDGRQLQSFNPLSNRISELHSLHWTFPEQMFEDFSVLWIKIVLYLLDWWQPFVWWSNEATHNSVRDVLGGPSENIYTPRALGLQSCFALSAARLLVRGVCTFFHYLNCRPFPLALLRSGLCWVMLEMAVTRGKSLKYSTSHSWNLILSSSEILLLSHSLRLLRKVLSGPLNLVRGLGKCNSCVVRKKRTLYYFKICIFF